MAVRALIAEDEPLAMRTVRDFLSGAGWVEVVGEASDGPTARRLLLELRPELVFLDVQMPGMSGLDLLEELDYDPAVVFTTAYDEFAVAAFELGAMDYLLKPFGRGRFEQALERVRRRLGADGGEASTRRRAAAVRESGPLGRIFVRRGEQILPLAVADIVRLEAQGDYVLVHARDGSYLVSLGLREFERRLDPDCFRRVHRSHVVNLDQVVSIESFDRRLLFRMRDGSEVLASRAASQSLRDLVL